jgi:hypothetical protein
MEYTTRIVRSSEGLTKEAALLGLQEHPSFMPGTKIANIYNQGGRWVAKLMEPKVANETCQLCQMAIDPSVGTCQSPQCLKQKTAAGAFEDLDASPAEMHDESHDESAESPLEEIEEIEKDDEHEEKHEQSEEKKLNELEKKLDLLLDALGISEKGDEPKLPSDPEDLEGPEADLPAAPAPKSGPSKPEPLPPGSGAKLKPGEVPNKPGMTPVGAPAFASVKTASCEGSCEKGTCENCDKQHKEAQASMPPNAVNAPAGATPSASGPVAQASCPKCGQANCSCNQPNVNPTSPGASGPVHPGTVASFTASRLDSGNALTIRQAKAQLENHYEGFRVARIKRDGDAIHARMERTAGPRWDAFKDKARGNTPEVPAATNPVTRDQAQDANAAYQQQFDQDLQENAINRQKAIRKIDPYYTMDPLNQSYENEKDQEFTEENHKLPYPGANEYSQNYF